MSMDDCQQGFIKCPDCNFISLSQGGLGVHRSKRHKIIIPDDVKSLYVERIFPEGKSVYCCLCDVTIGSIQNFRRHMKNKHESIKLFESAKCSICGLKFPKGRGAGIHLQRNHKIGSKNSYPHSPTPVMSFTNRDIPNTPRSSRRTSRRSNPLSSTFSQDPCHVPNSSVYSSTIPNEDISDNVPVQHQSSPINPNQSLNPSDPTIDEDSTPCDSSTSQPSSNIPRSLNPSAYPFFPTTRSSGYVPQDHAQSSSPVHSQPSTPVSLCPASVHHSHSIHSQSLPQPQLIDLEEDDDFNTNSPPRPLSNDHSTFSPEPPTNPPLHNSSTIPNFGVSRPIHNQQIWLEAEVVLSDCTKVDSYVTSQRDDLESEVALNGCTNENSDSPSQYANPEPSVSLSDCSYANRDIPYQLPLTTPERIPSQLLPNPPVISITPTSHQTYPESSVALSGCTAVDGDVVPNQPSNPFTSAPHTPPSPPTASQNPFIIPPPLPDSFLSSSTTYQSQPNIGNNPIHQSSPEPTVALSGCTAADGDVVPNQSPNPSTSTHHTPPPLTASQNPFIIPPPLPDSFLSSSTTYQSQPNNDNNQVPNPNPPPNNDNDPIQDRWSSVFLDTISWDVFSNQCKKLFEDVIKTSQEKQPKKASAGPRHPLRPSARPINNNRAPLRYNPREARKIQAIYRLSKKRAARQVLNNNSPSYTGSTDDANTFFTNVFGEKHCNADEVKRGLNDFVPSSPVDGNLYAPVSPEEATKKLRSLSNSAPGSDKVEYRHLRSFDPKCTILSKIFNRCLVERDVPEMWKTSSTILFHKGDASDVSNFRPIALMSCIYKLFMSIIANRLVTFSVNNNLLSDVQKSARPSEGCYEHTYILQSLVLDAKRHSKDLYLSWLDLKNAFGSISHDVIQITLKHLGVPDGIVELVNNVYTNATTVVTTPSGTTPPIPLLAGVKQGCPLSPILFNLCVEIILRSIAAKGQSIGPLKHHGCDISVLAYADDLVIIAKNEQKLQQLLDAASTSASLIGLTFRQDKCAQSA